MRLPAFLALLTLCAPLLATRQQGMQVSTDMERLTPDLHALRGQRFTAPKKWALCIGAGDYEHLGKLKYAAGDARQFAQTLVQDFQFLPNNVSLLADGGLAATAPNSANILKELDTLLARKDLDKGDLFIFYFSGHGVGTDKGDFLAPTDATMEDVERVGLPVKTITKRFVDAGLKNGVIIADACRAGNENPFGTELEKLSERSNLAVMLSTKPGRRAYELARYQRGAFTYSLLRALKDEKLRDPVTGGLWVSNVSRAVRDDVIKMTERDYGEYAQQPTAWNDRTGDILFAAFPPTNRVTMAAVQVALEQKKKEGPLAYGRALFLGARVLSEVGQKRAAADLMLTLDRIGQGGPREWLFLSDMLSASGRPLEAAKIDKRLMALPENDYYRQWTVATSNDPTVTPEKKLAALRGIWLTDGDAQTAADLAWYVTSFLPQSIEKQKALLKEFVTYYGPESRPGLFFGSRLAWLEGDMPGALSLMSKCLKVQGGGPDAHTIYLAVYELLIELDRNDDARRFVDSAYVVDVASADFWAVEKARGLQHQDREKTLAFVKSHLPKLRSVEFLLPLLGTCGVMLPKLADDIKKMRVVWPQSWEALAAEWLCEWAELPQDVRFDYPAEVMKWAPNQLEAKLDIFDVMDEVFTDVIATKQAEESDRKSVLGRGFYGEMLLDPEPISNNPHSFFRFTRYGMQADRHMALAQFAAKYIYPKVFAGQFSGRYAWDALDIAMNSGDDAMAAKIYASQKWGGPDSMEEPLRYALYLACRGKFAESRALFGKVVRQTKHRSMTEIYDGLDIYLLWNEGKVDAAKAKLKTFDPMTMIGLNMLALASAFENSGPARGKLGLSCDNYEEEFLFVRAACVKRLDYFFRTPSVDTTPPDYRLHYIANIAFSTGNPLYEELMFVDKPGEAQFAGEFDLLTIESDDALPGKLGAGTVSFRINAGGEVSGKIEFRKKSESFKGKLDRYGNIRGATGSGVGVFGKIPPPGIYKSAAVFKEMPLGLHLLDKSGAQINLILMEKKPSKQALSRDYRSLSVR